MSRKSWRPATRRPKLQPETPNYDGKGILLPLSWLGALASAYYSQKKPESPDLPTDLTGAMAAIPTDLWHRYAEHYWGPDELPGDEESEAGVALASDPARALRFKTYGGLAKGWRARGVAAVSQKDKSDEPGGTEPSEE